MTISKNMLVIFVFLFLDVVTVSMILPWMPSLLETYESEKVSCIICILQKEWFYTLSKKYIQYLGFVLGFQEGSTWDRVFIGGMLLSLAAIFSFQAFCRHYHLWCNLYRRLQPELYQTILAENRSQLSFRFVVIYIHIYDLAVFIYNFPEQHKDIVLENVSNSCATCV